MIFDNIDRDAQYKKDMQGQNIMSFIPSADYIYVLVTTRLASLGQIGRSTEITMLNINQCLELPCNRSSLLPSSGGKMPFEAW